MPNCTQCGGAYSAARSNLGYRTCLDCGDEQAKKVKFTVMIPFSKGAYQLVSTCDIAHTNPKR